MLHILHSSFQVIWALFHMLLTITAIVPLLGCWGEFGSPSSLISLSLSQWTKWSLSLGCLGIPFVSEPFAFRYIDTSKSLFFFTRFVLSYLLCCLGILCCSILCCRLQTSLTTAYIKKHFLHCDPVNTHIMYMKQKFHKMLLLLTKHPAWYSNGFHLILF